MANLTAMPDTLPKPELILTHESDLDGMLSGMLLQRLAQHLFGVRIPIQAFHNHNWRQRGLPEKSAWVSDLSFEHRLDKLNWVVIDHHSTDCKPRLATLIHDPTKSASLLCYELCQAHGVGNDALAKLVRYSNIADLFIETEPDFQDACDYASLVKSYGFWNLFALIGGDPEKLLDHPLLEVMRVKRRLENPLGLEWSRRHIQEITPTVGYVSVVVGNSNAIVNALLEEGATSHPVLVTLFRKSNSVVLASFRSRNGEALAIATQLQGGGHPNACGATLPRSVGTISDGIAYLRRVLAVAAPVKPATGINDLESALENLNIDA